MIYFIRIIFSTNIKMDSHKNLDNNNNDTYDEFQIIDDLKSINIINMNEVKKQLNGSNGLFKLLESKLI